MRTKNIIFLIIALLGLTAPAFSDNSESEEISGMRKDIQIINLLNNMDLRKEQMEFILNKAKEVGQIKKDAAKAIYSNNHDKGSVYSAIKEEVNCGRVSIDKYNANKLRELKNTDESVLRQAYEKIEAAALGVENNLEEFQLVALDGYKPCIIPIMKEGRIGQAEKAKGVIKILEKVKDVSQTQYYQFKDAFIERIMEKIRAKVAPGAILKEEIRMQIENTFARIRGMDAADFLLKKDALAEELLNSIMPAKKEMTRSAKIKQFLLSDRIIPILEERLEKKSLASSEAGYFVTVQ